MRQVTALMTTLSLILIAAPCLAKGPSSATVAVPGMEEPIELFDHRHHEPKMQEHMFALVDQTGLWYPTPSLERVQPPADLGEPLTLVWGEGQKTIRQVIYLHAEGGPVIHTPEDQPTLRAWGSDITGWFRAPNELGDTLRAFGVPTEEARTSALSSPVLVIAALVVGIAGALRFVNSRLRPVVSNQ